MAKSTLAAALRDVNHMVAQTRGLVALQEELEKGVEIEKLVKEAGARLEQIKAEEARLETKLAEAANQRDRMLAAAKAEAETIRADGRAEVKTAAAEAARVARQKVEDERLTILAAARSEGNGYVAAAQTDAEDLRGQAGAALAQARFQAAELVAMAQATASASERAAAEAEVSRGAAVKEEAAARDRLAALKAEIEHLMNRFAA